MRIALDTNRYSDLVYGDLNVVRTLKSSTAVFMPFAVVAELRAGFLAGSRAAQNEQLLTQFLNEPRVSLLLSDEQTTHHFAALSSQLRRQGTPLPVSDIWIAALVLQHNLILYTRDAHFDHLPQIPRI